VGTIRPKKTIKKRIPPPIKWVPETPGKNSEKKGRGGGSTEKKFQTKPSDSDSIAVWQFLVGENREKN